MSSIEHTTEAAIAGFLGLDTTLAAIGVKTHDDHAQTDEFAGIVVSAKSDGVISDSAASSPSRRVEKIEVTVSLRSLVPAMSKASVAEAWGKITTAILSPSLPAPATPEDDPDGEPVAKTWPEVVPALADVAYFSAIGETGSDRTDEDDRRTHTRTFVVWVALTN